MNQALVSLENGIPSTTSLKVAEVFHKRHGDVIRSISGILSQVPEIFGKRNFALSEYAQKNNLGEKRLPMYTMTRDGFTLLVMGYTGKEAMKFKLAYIDAFNEMERQLKKQQPTDGLLSPDLRAELKALVDAKLSMFPDSVQGKARAELWTRFNRRFRIAEYAQLPAGKMADARDYIITLELRAVKGIETKAAPAPALVPAKKPAKPAPMARELKDLASVQSKLDLLIQTVQLGGLQGFSTADDPTIQALVKSRNAHILAASNCLIMAKQAIKAALA